MTCAHCVDAADFFGKGIAQRELARYRRRGPTRSTQLLLDGVTSLGVEGASFLDVGGGIGAVQQELLAAGASAGTGVDASPAYLASAQAEARRRGTLDRLTFLEGDAVELAGELPEVDIVTLDRVLCCYPHMERLVEISCRRSRRIWGAVVPREDWWIRLGGRLLNGIQALRGKAFRLYLHGVPRIESAVEARGFQAVASRRTWLWEIRVFARTGV
ncbi:MAG: class I SAM-dependent methyltransferase [Gemmatimonadota bacterium]|jgi:SAM-dependent methyltransferase